MFSWMTRTRTFARPASPSTRRARLSVEALEDRCCLSAPQVTLTAVQELANHQVKVSGGVMDDSSPTVTINLGGVAAGQATVTSNSGFSFVGAATALGQISATGVDTLNQTSNTAQIAFTSNPPAVSNLQFTWGANKQVTITGVINDEFPGGLTVTFGGAASGSVSADSSGHFSATLTATQIGQVTVGTTDQWNQNSAAASITLTNNAPTITNFTATQGALHSWTFTGKVTDDQATSGLTVYFGGLPELKGETAVVAADGTFTLTVTLAAGESGNVTCNVADVWGANSNTGSTFIFSA